MPKAGQSGDGQIGGKGPHIAAAAALSLSLCTGPMRAQELVFSFAPLAEVTAQDSLPIRTQSLPAGPIASQAAIQQRAPMWRKALRIPLPAGQTSADLATTLRDDLTAAGYALPFACAAADCGGYDFRLQLDLLPEPDMHVNMGDFHYILAQRGTGQGAETLAAVISRSPHYGFVQLMGLGTAPQPRAKLTEATKSPLPAAPLIQALQAGQSVVLDEARFAPSSATLLAGDMPQLAALAAWLKAEAPRQITLHGYTDSSGAAQTNQTLSLARADALRDWLVRVGVPAGRIVTKGFGADNPRADNSTAAGRAQNRRIEAALR